ncbi:type IV pilus modification PilV family protein [Psychroserpens algicola]|uniref:Type II secretion system protein n=1 Tax=Psychroserpens algicola TaxID=1719034 RepID=A0ABT0H984_9FLAO|nr:hypothetical protein [Psychroserpens algicola]MCK8480932.1 hypothetical protein [Psychroserpens algicola]
MKLLKNSNKVKASSLLESIIAIVLISICSLVALTVYLNVISQNNPNVYYEAKHKIETLTQNAQVEQDFEDDTYNYKRYSIEKNVTIKSKENIALLNYTVSSGDKTYVVKKIVTIEQKD